MLPEELDSFTKKQNVKKARKDRMERRLGSYNISPSVKEAVWWTNQFASLRSGKSLKKARSTTPSPLAAKRDAQTPPVVEAVQVHKAKRGPNKGAKVAKTPEVTLAAKAKSGAKRERFAIDAQPDKQKQKKPKKLRKKANSTEETEQETEETARVKASAKATKKAKKTEERKTHDRDLSLLKVSPPARPHMHQPA